jgi:hypothetical protein
VLAFSTVAHPSLLSFLSKLSLLYKFSYSLLNKSCPTYMYRSSTGTRYFYRGIRFLSLHFSGYSMAFLDFYQLPRPTSVTSPLRSVLVCRARAGCSADLQQYEYTLKCHYKQQGSLDSSVLLHAFDTARSSDARSTRFVHTPSYFT